MEDVPATYEKLRAAGVETVSPPVRFADDSAATVASDKRVIWQTCIALLHDPDGNLLELNEIGTEERGATTARLRVVGGVMSGVEQLLARTRRLSMEQLL